MSKGNEMTEFEEQAQRWTRRPAYGTGHLRVAVVNSWEVLTDDENHFTDCDGFCGEIGGCYSL